MYKKFIRRPTASLPAAALVILVGASCGTASSTGSTSTSGATGTSKATNFGPTVQAKFAYFVSTDTAVGQGAKKFASLVAADTGNTVQIQVYPNSELGTVPSVLQAVSGGRIQFVATTNLSALVPSADAILAPYIFSSTDQAQKVLNSSVLQQALWSKFAAKNAEVIGVWGQGFADLLTKKPVKTPADLQGMRIRIYDPGVGVPQYKALGADAVNMTPNQVFTALSTNAIDGAEDPVATLYGLHWNEEAKYLAQTEHSYVSAPVLASTQFMNSLTAAQKQGVLKAFNDTIAYEVQQSTQIDATALAALKAAGTVVTPVDKAAFKAKLSPLYSEFAAKFPGTWAALAKAGADISNG